jgi:mono/diheme cytochrome c family protein
MPVNRTLYRILLSAAGIMALCWIGQQSVLSGNAASSTAATSAASAIQSRQAISAVDTGKELYMQNCMSCHAADGHGSSKYPDIAGDKFKRKYGTIDKAYAFISTNMPENAPGSLRDEEYKAIVRYVLGLNGIPTEFTDISDHWAAAQILDLQDKGYIDGYTEQGKLLYKPDRNITREEFVTYLVKSKELFLSNETSSTMTDVSKSKRKTYIITAIEYRLIDGYPDGTFRPDKPISRAEIAAVLSRSEALATPDAGLAAAKFKDVTSSHWAYALIDAAASAGLFNGYEDGTFRPGNPITRAEAAAVLYRIVHSGK